jgi:predicted phosphodiesterase
MMLLKPDVSLGQLEGRVLLFGGPYSNLQALQAMRTVAAELAIPPQSVICNGDVVAYCGEPEACVESLRDWGCHVLMGNCEESLAAGADDCGCGFGEGTACDLLSAAWYRFALAHVSHASRQWMGSLPRLLRFTLGGMKVAVVHGSADRINQFIFASDPVTLKSAQRRLLGVELVVGGHAGLPFIQAIAGGNWLNTGAIGMPANDGSRDGWYALLDAQPDGRIVASLRRLPYDWQTATTMMQAAGLNNGYAAALHAGLWPSLDVLPAAERQHTGIALQEVSVDLYL